jgi:type IV pilus assembly protein PilE
LPGENTIRTPITLVDGFSLIEVMIVTVMLVILLTLAAPSYREYSLRSHRIVATTLLLQAASCQERLRAEVGLYDTTKCIASGDDHYVYQFEPAGLDASTVFEAKAVPVHTQTRDHCGSLSLKHNGVRSVGNISANTGQCWAGR